MKSNLCKECRKEPRMGPLQSRCLKCTKTRLRAKEQAKKERLKVKRQKHKERPAALKKKLDIIFSKYIRLRDKGKPCITSCRPWEPNHQTGHLISRRYMATRWDEQNAHGQSPADNMWGGGEQLLHALAVDKLYGPGTAERILRTARDPNFKLTTEFLHERISHFTKKLQDLEEMRQVS
jgi:hypothetical protein